VAAAPQMPEKAERFSATAKMGAAKKKHQQQQQQTNG